jgi:uncharacterized protein with NAD-binding domain and iron-sulfur cluster
VEQAIRPQRLTPIGDGDTTAPGWYRLCFPGNRAHPGTGNARIDTWQSLIGVIDLAAHFTDQSLDADPALAPMHLALATVPPVSQVPGMEDVAADLSARQLRVADAPAYLHLVAHAARNVDARDARLAQDDLQDIVGHLRQLSHASRASAITERDQGDLLSQQFDVVAAFAAGIVADVLIGEAQVVELDRLDFRAWLVRHGAGSESVRRSPFVTALYDTMFQYPEGDHAQPRYGAGTAAQVVLRMLGTYCGALAWKPAAGTGQAVIAPLYSVLQQRGVQFRFFHKLVDIGVDPHEDAITSLVFDRQADVAGAGYSPVRMRNGLLSWDAEPDWSALENGTELQREGVDFESHWCSRKVGELALQHGEDFDDAILAIPLGAFKPLNADRGPCARLLERSRRWRRLTARQRLVPSVSVQAWSSATLQQLGWDRDGPSAVSGPPPLGIWADMSELLQYEDAARPNGAAASLHYFCDVLRSELYRQPAGAAGVAALAAQDARTLAQHWFETQARFVWRSAPGAEAFDWNTLFSQRNFAGAARFGDQVVRANIDPASCCVASAPGTTRSRLKCDGSGFAHLYLAGSWIDTGFNTECIEAAVMSGMQAARAITGEAREIPGEHFLHPEYEELSLCELVRETALWMAGG